MEAFAIIPILLMIFIYLGIIVFTIWLAISFLNAQKQRNTILREISSKLDGIKIEKLDE
jgi:hypothetical protein